MVARECNLEPGEFIHTLGDAHIYNNHIEQCRLQLTRTPRALPRLILNPEVRNLLDFTFNDIQIAGYDPYPAIKGEISV